MPDTEGSMETGLDTSTDGRPVPKAPDPDRRLRPAGGKVQVLLLAILALGFLLRLGYWLDVRNDPFTAQLVMDSEEYDRWAREIAAGDWLGKEAFFQAPLYPYFLALIYSVFGHSLNAVYLIQILLSLVGGYALYRAGKILKGKAAGLAALALWAIYGVFIFYDVQLQKESLVIILCSLTLWLLLAGRDGPTLRQAFGMGLLCGGLALLRENVLLAVPFLFFWTGRRTVGAGASVLRAGALLAGLATVLLPVAFRNWAVGGSFLPTTFNGGVSFYIGNNPGANGTYQPIVPGKEIPVYERAEPVRIARQETGKDLSPAAISGFWLKKALAWAVREPLPFLKLQIKKTGMFWSFYEWPDAVDYYHIRRTSIVLGLPLLGYGSLFLLSLLGLAFRASRTKDLVPVLAYVVLWMATTVVFFLFSRYRLPVVPGLILLAAMPIAFLREFIRAGAWTKTALTSLAILLGLGTPFFISFKPRLDLVHYNLGLIFERQGELGKARLNYQEALKANPRDFLSCINLGNLAARENDWSRALEWDLKAAVLEPRSEGALINAGRALIALGRIEEAGSYLDRALALNPDSLEALHNKSVLMAIKGDLEEAWRLNARALKLSPGWAPALQFQARLRRRLQKKD